MRKYTDLLAISVKAMAKSYRERSKAKLTFDRNATIAPQAKQIEKISDFELITWLVIK
ncbi:MAG: hypothetical protein LH472_00395 [Pyrinomonadaceae bacterium]|nr:hypothetical protein [Pyrinomonadaceae bacterium]